MSIGAFIDGTPSGLKGRLISVMGLDKIDINRPFGETVKFYDFRFICMRFRINSINRSFS